MSRKAYSLEERQNIEENLIVYARRLYREKGFRDVGLNDILKEVGISKAFFYTFYPSYEELVLRIFERQRQYILDFAYEAVKRENLNWEEKFSAFFDKVFDQGSEDIYIMTHRDEVKAAGIFSPEVYERYMSGQNDFYEDILVSWGIDPSLCDRKVLCNLIRIVTVLGNSGKDFAPFAFQEKIRETVEFQKKILINYLFSVRHKNDI